MVARTLTLATIAALVGCMIGCAQGSGVPVAYESSTTTSLNLVSRDGAAERVRTKLAPLGYDVSSSENGRRITVSRRSHDGNNAGDEFWEQTISAYISLSYTNPGATVTARCRFLPAPGTPSPNPAPDSPSRLIRETEDARRVVIDALLSR